MSEEEHHCSQQCVCADEECIQFKERGSTYLRTRIKRRALHELY